MRQDERNIARHVSDRLRHPEHAVQHRVGHDLLRRPVARDPAAVEHDDALCKQRRKIEIVQDGNDRDAARGATADGLVREMEDHIRSLEFDVRVRLVDIDRYRERAGKLARGELPRKQADGDPASAVAEALGRALTPVERLLVLRMQADNKTPQEMARVLHQPR